MDMTHLLGGGGEEGEGGEDAIPLIRARGDCEQTSLHLAPVQVSNSSHTLSPLVSLSPISRLAVRPSLDNKFDPDDPNRSLIFHF
jgi:hypothetical protein